MTNKLQVQLYFSFIINVKKKKTIVFYQTELTNELYIPVIYIYIIDHIFQNMSKIIIQYTII
jgi:hypothetical protein